MKNMKNDIVFFWKLGGKTSKFNDWSPFFPTKNCNVTRVKPDFQTHPQLELTNQPCLPRLRTPLSPRPPARRRDSNLMEASSGMILFLSDGSWAQEGASGASWISRRPFSSNSGHTITSPEPTCPCFTDVICWWNRPPFQLCEGLGLGLFGKEMFHLRLISFQGACWQCSIQEGWGQTSFQILKDELSHFHDALLSLTHLE